MKNRVLFTIFFLVYICNSVNAQYKNIQLPKPKKSTYRFAQVEPSIAINPNNTKQVVAGTVMDEYYYSKNGGKTWRSMNMSSNFGVNGDPCVIFDKFGAIYYFHLASVPGGQHLDRIVCQKSTSLKGKFNEGTFPVPNGKVQDKEWVAVDYRNNNMFMTWTQFDKYNEPDTAFHSNIVFSMSSDGADTWSDPLEINSVYGDCADDDNTVEGATPAVGPNGEIYVAWTGPNGVVFNRSLDTGKTWLKNEIKIAEHPEGWTINVPGIYRCNGLPILKCDISDGPNRGKLYLNWADQRNGTNDTDIWIATSDDGGMTWTDPIRVNQDKTKTHQFFTWMDIDQCNGDVYFVYYDRSNYNTSSIKTDVVVCLTSDGGKTFKAKVVSESPFEPNDKLFFGDYNNISVVDGMVRPIWTRMHESKISVWTALIDGF
jgi:Neuraminidase (sialidase)